MARKPHHILSLNGVSLLHIGEMEIWDGADLSLLRDTLTRMIDRDRLRKVGVDMSFVKYIPSGFFGMLCDWREEGIRIFLLNPQPNVQAMLWFTRFFRSDDDLLFELHLDLHTGLQEPEDEADDLPLEDDDWSTYGNLLPTVPEFGAQ